MIIYELACTQAHRFEGWFASAADFARQSETDLVRCPVCDDPKVERVPSAKVRSGARQASLKQTATVEGTSREAEPATPAVEQTVAGLPAELVRKLRDAVNSADNVGRRFPEEARKIHYDEVPARPIRGQASREEAEALQEEGIDFASLPAFLTRDIQ
jgi:hypothetical protein